MSEHAQTLDLLARILEAVEKNHDATIQLAEALAGVRAVKVAKIETEKVIDKAKEPAAPAPTPEVPAPASAPEAAAPTYEDAKKVLMALPTDQAKAILKTLGVNRLSDLAVARFNEVIEAARHV